MTDKASMPSIERYRLAVVEFRLARADDNMKHRGGTKEGQMMIKAARNIGTIAIMSAMASPASPSPPTARR